MSTARYVWKVIGGKLRSRGFKETARMLFYEIRYGIEFGRRTTFIVTTANLDVDDTVKRDAHYYSPSNYYMLKRAFRSLEQKQDLGSFVDIGCGAGRVLLFAAKYPFEEIIGVEASSRLCDISREMLTRYAVRKSHKVVPWRVECIDAQRFVVPDTCRVIFMFNPFGDATMSAVLDNILASYRRNPRPMQLVHAAPCRSPVLEGNASLRRCHEDPEFVVYRVGEPSNACA